VLAQRVTGEELAPNSLPLREIATENQRKACQWPAFAIQGRVSRLQIWRLVGPNCRKSPTNIQTFPFWEPTPETGFDRHCMAGLAVFVAVVSDHLRVKSGVSDDALGKNKTSDVKLLERGAVEGLRRVR